MKYLFILFFVTVTKNVDVAATVDFSLPDKKYALDLNLFENVLDPKLCDAQLDNVRNNPELLLAFMDAGVKTPRGILTGNFLDLGNYYQCLAIKQNIPQSVVEGKYCMIELPLAQDIEWQNITELQNWPDIPWQELNPQTRYISNTTHQQILEYNKRKAGIDAVIGSKYSELRSHGNSLAFQLAVCIPKVCSSQQFFDTLLSIPGLKFRETFCRLPNDKPWVPADYVAIVVFSFLGLLLILSTGYEILHNVYHRSDPKSINKLYQSFSIYNNTRRLVTYTPVPGAIECLDGIRAIAMIWVIVGHSFFNKTLSGVLANPLDALNWMTSLKAVWIMAAPITVDTFFMISGLLLVYTTASKMTHMKLLKNLYIFYLYRILRIIPVLAAMILLQASLFNWIIDGPYWEVNMTQVHNCRVSWWSTLLHIQNYVSTLHMCLPHTWYLAVDMQLYFISPIILFWVFGRSKKSAWIALFGSLIIILTVSTTFNFIKNFPSVVFNPFRVEDLILYVKQYYMNTLTRASPFFVGLIFGYLLHIYRGQECVVPKIYVTISWFCAFLISFLSIYSTYPAMQLDWDNQFADNMINSFMRPAWAMALGWLIFACQHGYTGPINWLLSLGAWKTISRLSYAIYIVHYPLILLVNATAIAPIYFTVNFALFKFLADFTLSVIVAFLLNLFVDAPCSVIVKHLMGGDRGTRKVRPTLENGTDLKKTQYDSYL